jgi:hypothetical protein
MDRIDEIRARFQTQGKEPFSEWMSRRNDYVATYGIPQGQRALMHQMEKVGFFSSNYTRNNDTTFFEGARDHVLSLQRYIPGLFGMAIATYYEQKESEMLVMIQNELTNQNLK